MSKDTDLYITFEEAVTLLIKIAKRENYSTLVVGSQKNHTNAINGAILKSYESTVLNLAHLISVCAWKHEVTETQIVKDIQRALAKHKLEVIDL